MVLNKQDITVLKRLNTKAKIAIAVLLTSVFVIGVSIPYLINRGTNNTINSPPKRQPSVNLSLISKTTARSVDSTVDVEVNIVSPNAQVDAADVTIFFDPEILKVQSIENGDFFQSVPVKRIEKNYVKIRATAVLKDNKVVLPQGTGSIANIVFSVIKPTDETLIYFDPDHTVIASEGKDVTGTLSDLTLQIK